MKLILEGKNCSTIIDRNYLNSKKRKLFAFGSIKIRNGKTKVKAFIVKELASLERNSARLQDRLNRV